MWRFRCAHAAVLLGILWLAVSKSGAVNYYCDPGWRYLEASCYMFSLVSYNWMSARHDCRSRFTDLTKVQSAAANNFIAGRQSAELRKSPVWIGLNDRQRPNTFVWSDGTALTATSYTNWIALRPEDRPPGNCVEMYASNTESERIGQWVSTVCSASNKLYVCQSLPLEDPWVKDHGDCGQGWYLDPDTDLCFLVQTTPMLWQDAESSCSSRGSHLATIFSSPQQLFLNRLTGRLGITDNTWIGASGLRNGTLVWSSSLNNAFRNFHPHESLPDLDSRCLSMKTSDATSFWSAEACSTPTRPSVCQRPTSNANRCGADGTWKVFTNVCYKVFPNQAWQAASAACTRENSRFAMVKSQSQFDFIFDLLRQHYAGISNVTETERVGWLGLRLVSSDGGARMFQWEDGTPLDESLQYFTDSNQLARLLSEGSTCVGMEVTPYIRKVEAFRFPRNCSGSLPFVCQKAPTFERRPLRGTGPVSNESLIATTTQRWDVPTRPTEPVIVPGGQSHSAVIGPIVGPIVGAVVIIAIVVGVSVFLKFYLPSLPENHVIRRSIRRLSTRMRRSGRRQMQSPYSQSFVELSAITSDSETSGDPPAMTDTSGQPALQNAKKPMRNGRNLSENGGPRRGANPRGFGPRGARDAPVRNGDVTPGAHVGGSGDVRGGDKAAGRPPQGPPESRGRPDLVPPDRKADPYYNVGPAGAGAQRSVGSDDVRTPRGAAVTGDANRVPRSIGLSDVKTSPSYLPPDVKTSPSYLPPDVKTSPSYLPPDVKTSPSYLPPDARNRPGNVPGDVGMPRSNAPSDVRNPYSNVPPDARNRPGDVRNPYSNVPPDARNRPGDVRTPQSNAPGDVRNPYSNAPPDARNRPGDVRTPLSNVPGDVRNPYSNAPPDARNRPGNAPGDVRMPRSNAPPDARAQPRNFGPSDARGQRGNPPGDVRMQPRGHGPPDVRTQRGNAPADVRGRDRPPGPSDRRPDPYYNTGPADASRQRNMGPGDARSPQGPAGPGGAGRMPHSAGPPDVRGPPGDVRGRPGGPGGRDGRPGEARPPQMRAQDPRPGYSGAGNVNVGGAGAARYDGPPRSQNI